MKTQLDIFISAPDDVNSEKEIINKVVKSLNIVYADTEHYSFKIIESESTDGYPIPEYDIFIGILWKTFKTTASTSKIEEEFKKALKMNTKSMFYFSNIPISPDEIDTYEFNKILEFKDIIKKEKLYYEYNSLNAFEDLIYNNLRILATEKNKKESDIDSTIKEEKGIFDLMNEFISNFESAEKDIESLTKLFESMDEKTQKIPEPKGEDITSFISYSNSLADFLDDFSDEFETNKKELSIHFSDGINAFIELIGPFGKYIEESEIKSMVDSINGCIYGIDEFNNAMIEVSKIFEDIPPITKKFNKSKQRFIKNIKDLLKDLKNFKGMLYTSLEELD